MLLIRGFNQEQYAREIQKGRIGFRDLLTTLLYPESNGYKLSNYYEKSLIEAAIANSPFEINCENSSSEIQKQLNIIFNPFIPHFYLSYFHILNQNSEKWLDNNFDNESHFVYAIPKLQKIGREHETLYGQNMIGSSMVYLPQDGVARTPQMLCQKVGMVYLMQNELDACQIHGGATQNVAVTLSNMMVAVCCEAFARRCDAAFNESENEFRFIYKTPTPFSYEKGSYIADEERPFFALVDGIPYKGTFFSEAVSVSGGYRRSHNMLLETENPMIANPITTLKEVFDNKRDFKVLPHFLPVNIKHSFDQYGYIGNKEECRKFIELKLKEGV